MNDEETDSDEQDEEYEEYEEEPNYCAKCPYASRCMGYCAVPPVLF